MIKENWSAILGHIKTEYELTDISFNTWLKPLSVFQVDEEEAIVRVNVPSDQMGITYIKNKYLLPPYKNFTCSQKYLYFFDEIWHKK